MGRFKTEKKRVDAFRNWAFRQFMKARYFPEAHDPLMKFAKALSITAKQQVTSEQLDAWEALLAHKARGTGPYADLGPSEEDTTEEYPVNDRIDSPEDGDSLAERLRIRAEIDAMTSTLRTADSHVSCKGCGNLLAKRQLRERRDGAQNWGYCHACR